MRSRDAGAAPDAGFVGNPGELIAGTLVPSIEQGVAPLTALGGSAPVTFDLSGAASRRTSERVVGILLWICGALSLLTTVGIIAVLIRSEERRVGKECRS